MFVIFQNGRCNAFVLANGRNTSELAHNIASTNIPFLNSRL